MFKTLVLGWIVALGLVGCAPAYSTGADDPRICQTHRRDPPCSSPAMIGAAAPMPASPTTRMITHREQIRDRS
jgi:hypothetical protein